MLVLGWSLAPITLYHLVPLSIDALSWRELLPASSRPGFRGVVWIRWIRELISSLLPVAGVGGDIAAARLAHKGGVPGAQAAASMVVDITVGAGTQLVFVLAGVALLAVRPNADAADAVARATLIGVAVFAAAIGAFVLVQHNSMFAQFVRLARRRRAGEMALRLRRPCFGDRRGRHGHISSPLGLPARQRVAPHWLRGRRRRDLAGDVFPQQTPQPDRCVYPGKPQFRRPRGGVHGARER